jgi:hypothetical protein
VRREPQILRYEREQGAADECRADHQGDADADFGGDQQLRSPPRDGCDVRRRS